MSPPANAKDKREGFCIQCCDWHPWSKLQVCSACEGTVCEDHADGVEHDCEEK